MSRCRTDHSSFTLSWTSSDRYAVRAQPEHFFVEYDGPRATRSIAAV